MILCGADNSVSGLIYLQHTRFAVLLLVMQKKTFLILLLLMILCGTDNSVSQVLSIYSTQDLQQINCYSMLPITHIHAFHKLQQTHSAK